MPEPYDEEQPPDLTPEPDTPQAIPQTGYGGPNLGRHGTEGDIDRANQWMRQQPWYQDYMHSIGQDPGHPHLNKAQQSQLGYVMGKNGLPVPDQDEVDPGGNINPKGHKMRNFLIAAAIGGATIVTLGAAGVFAGAAGAGGAAGGAGGAAAGGAAGGAAAGGAAAGAAPLASTVIGSGFVPAIAGGTGIAGGAAAGGAALAPLASEAFAPTAGVLPTGGAGLAGVGTEATVAGGAAAAPETLASTTTAPTAGVLPTGAEGLSAADTAAEATPELLSSTQTAPTSGELPEGGTGLKGVDTSRSLLDKGKDLIGNDKTGKIIKGVEPILGNMAKAGADANAARDRLLPSMQTAKLAQQKFALEAPSTRMGQSVRASGIKNAMPTKVNWGGPGSGLRGQIPSFTGGFTNALSTLDPQAKALADETLHKNLTDQLSGKDDLTPFLDQFQKESLKDKIVGGAATGAGLYTGVYDALHPKPKVMT